MFRSWYYRRLRKANLFRYWDGRSFRAADGLRLWKRFLADKTIQDPLIMKGVEDQEITAADLFLEAAARVLEVERYDPRTGRGLTEAELTDVFLRFTEWVREKKNLLGNWRTSSPTSVPPPRSSPNSPPSGSPESSSTPTASGCEAPPI